MQKNDLAERAFVRAMNLDVNDFESRYSLGRLYQSLDQMPLAVRYLEEAVKLNPGAARALSYLGFGLYALGRVQEAEDTFQKALAANQISPDYVPELQYGLFLQRSNQLEGSLTHLKKAVALGGQVVDPHFELSKTLQRLGRLPEARQALQDGLLVDGSDSRLHYLLARVCYELGDKECGQRHSRLSEDHRRPLTAR
jgi:tetratricopeptide (TPR) repeat protein